jgi:hypothetical protein
MQRTAKSHSGNEKEFKGGVDQDSKEELVKFRMEKYHHVAIIYFY